MEDGKNFYFDSLSKKFYVRVLYDSEEDDHDDIEVIGYDEAYDLFNYVKKINLF